MPCINHPEATVQSFCQTCGKPLCAGCVRTNASGQVFCDTCFATAAAQPGAAYWQAAAQGFVGPPPGSPNPAAAALLGLIPGVGAMYNSQFFKGLIHVVVFAVLVSITENYPIFGIFIAAWVFYQSFEAFHTAKARRDGLPLPDPFGLNELGSWLNLGGLGRSGGTGHATGHNTGPGVAPSQGMPPSGWAGTAPPGEPTGAPPAWTEPPTYAPPYTGAQYGSPFSNPSGDYVPPPPQQPPYAETFSGQNPDPYAGSYPPGSYPPGPIPPGALPPFPPMPPIPPGAMGGPFGSRGREPIWAFVLIGLGVVFLLQSMGFVSHVLHFAWPILLIGLGVYLIVRRIGPTRGGSK